MIKVNYDKETGKVIGFNRDTPNYIEITEEERRQPLPDKYSYYAVENDKFIIKKREVTEHELLKDEIQSARQRLLEIKNWFFKNDWKVNKIIVGEWKTDDMRWKRYLSVREVVRKEQDSLNEKIASNSHKLSELNNNN